MRESGSVKFRLAFAAGLVCWDRLPPPSAPLLFCRSLLLCANALRSLAWSRPLAAPLPPWLRAPTPPSIHGCGAADFLYPAALPATHHRVCLDHKVHLPLGPRALLQPATALPQLSIVVPLRSGRHRSWSGT